LAEALPVTAGRKQAAVQQAAVPLTPEVPYGTACALVAPLTGWSLRAHTAPAVTPVVAAGLTVLAVAPSREAILAQIAAGAAGQPGRPILVLAIEGAAVPTRPEAAKGRRPGRQQVRAQRARWTGEWRAAPGVRCELSAEDRSVPGLSWHQVQTDEAAAEALRPVQAAGLIPEAAVRWCVMADGARWIWKQAQALCPSAGEMLDSYHGRERRHKVAALPYGAPPERPRQWCEAALARLFDGEVPEVIGGRQRMNPVAAPAAEAIAKLLAYRQRQQGRLDDRCARTGGDPMGRGGIASANTGICPVRLQRSGAWWYVTHANQRLARRCATYHGTCDRVFVRYRQRRQDRSG
jgi:hypothetical protein